MKPCRSSDHFKNLNHCNYLTYLSHVLKAFVEKPRKNIHSNVDDLFQDAISAAGVEPTTSVEQAVRDASSSVGVVESVKSETRKIAKNRLDKDPDFKQISDSFPHSKSFARK